MNDSKVISSTQEQATASWVTYLNQLRINELIAKLSAQDINWQATTKILQDAKSTIIEEIVSRNRGGAKGMHGYIAEVLEVAFSNAEKVIEGNRPNTIWINDNGPVDIIRGDTLIQQKFVQSNFSLGAIKEHLEKYPDYLKSGGKYQIPKDFYEKVEILWKMSPEEAGKLTGNDGRGFSYKDWKRVHDFFENSGVKLSDLEPAKIDYDASKAGVFEKTIEAEKKKLKKDDQKIRDAAHQASKPTFKEGVNVTAVSAALEGSMALWISVRRKRKEGKKLTDYTLEDWKELGIDTAEGTAKGSVRGASMYVLTNYTATASNIASSLVTAVLGIAAQAKMLRCGELSDDDFIINSEVLCLEAAISAVSSILGEIAIPVPILGAVVGNTVGMFMYDVAKEYLSAKEQALISKYQNDMNLLNKHLDEIYQTLVNTLKKELEQFSSLLDWAFDPDVNRAFEGSVKLAQFVNASKEKILYTTLDIDTYFMT